MCSLCSLCFLVTNGTTLPCHALQLLRVLGATATGLGHCGQLPYALRMGQGQSESTWHS